MADLDLSGHKILIVDDVQFSRQGLRKLLFGFGQPDVLEAADGIEAQEALNSEPGITFVIADFKMPNANGLQLLKAIRSDRTKVSRSFPFGFLTGYSQESLVDMALSLDANAFLIKPVTAASLGPRLARMLEVTRDTSWLKPAETYDAVKIVSAGKGAPTREGQSKPAPGSTGIRAKATIRPSPRPAPPSEKFNEADLAGLEEVRREKFKASDLASYDLIRRASAASGGTEWSIAPSLVEGLESLAGDVGGDGTHRVVALMENLERAGTLSLDDAATLLSRRPAETAPSRAAAEGFTTDGEETFSPLDAIPGHAILARELHTRDGSLLMSVGTPLTAQVLAIVVHLDGIGMLALSEAPCDDSGTRGLFVRLPEAAHAVIGDVQQVSPEELFEGAILARDIYMTDGRMYMKAGTRFTARSISLLRDLEDLGRVDRKISVGSPL